MADKKISQLTGATTPLAGTEVLPIVQSGSTVKVSAADVTAGRAVSALTYTSTVTTGTAPLTVASTTEVANLRAANATSADASNAVKSNATTGVLQVVGPAAAATRVMTVPDANFTAARTDAAQSFTGTQTFVNTTVYEADAFGKRCMTGSNAGNPYTITITGVPGIGSGDYRDFTRITMIGVFSVASGHIVRGWAFYSSDYDGSARLIQTVGSVTIGGTITFSSSGSNPTATITNTSGNSADYEVWFRVFM